MNEEKVLSKLIEHDERFEHIEQNMATKSEMAALTHSMDKAMVILQRLDQERLFTNERIKRIEKAVSKS